MNIRLPVMRTLALTVTLLSLAARALVAQEKIERGYHTNTDPSLRIYVPTGSVTIVAWDRDSIAVSGVIGRNSKFFGGAGAGMAKMGVEVKDQGDSVLAEGSLTVSVPRKARVWLKMINGTIDVDGTRGELELYTIGGSVVVKRAAGVVSIESIDAPVTLIQANDDVRIRGGKGAVILRDVRGTSSVATVSGSVEIAGAFIPAGRVETIGGAIRVTSTHYNGAMLELQTHAGDIALNVNAADVPLLDLQSRAGKVTKPLPDGNLKSGRVVARSFKGTINVRIMSGIEKVKAPSLH